MSTVLLVIIVAVAVLLLRKPLSSGSGQFSYRRKPYLLSKAERSFYGVLSQAVGDNALIFSKVRVADVLAPQKGLNRANWQRAFNKISAKHVDFLLCDPQDCAVKLAIELDDASHGSAKRQKRDAFLEQACESAGLPLLRIRAARGYGVADIRQQVEAVLKGCALK
jgi:very-short-patch-repair endonuclease